MAQGKCNGCGRTDHAGGCDLVDFYFFQRFGRANDPPPPPPSPLIDSLTVGVDEGTPLPQQTDILLSQLPVQASTMMRVDIPVFHKETVKKPPRVETERIIGEKVRARNARQQAYRDRKKAEQVSG